MNKEFVPHEQAVALKELEFDEPCFGWYASDKSLIKDYVIKMHLRAPTFSQAINFLYIYSNKQIDIELKASDTYEERVRKINQGCEDLRNLQNNKSN